MPDTRRRKRGVRAPEALRKRVRELVDRHGTRGAAIRLGLSRDAVITLLADLPVLRGTIAQAEKHAGIAA